MVTLLICHFLILFFNLPYQRKGAAFVVIFPAVFARITQQSLNVQPAWVRVSICCCTSGTKVSWGGQMWYSLFSETWHTIILDVTIPALALLKPLTWNGLAPSVLFPPAISRKGLLSAQRWWEIFKKSFTGSGRRDKSPRKRREKG